MDVRLEPGWKKLLAHEFEKEYFQQLKSFLVEDRKKHQMYPPGSLIFNALDSTPAHAVKAVILGQDPYHGPGQAHGLCFSVPEGIPHPPSLQNILKELHNDLQIPVPASGDLSKWAKAGVLLLNATLTVRQFQAGSHQNKGWEVFTDSIIKTLSNQGSGIVFMLWGAYAQAKAQYIDTNKHFILKAAHPSPLSAYRGFFGCRHFSRTNNILISNNIKPIDWAL